jgi:aminopeptidase I
MVRNVASMQSLRHNMEDMNFDAPPRRTLYEDSYASSRSQLSPSQRITTIPQPRQHPIVQLCGTDDYTKQLMNRVATGVATEAEQKAFAQQVQRGLPEMVGSSSSRASSTRSSPQEDKTARFKQATRENAEKYTKPFCDFLTDNPTVFHCVDAVKNQLKNAGWKELSERDAWKIEPSGKYFVERNGSALMAFSVGGQYKPGNGAAILAGHVDALTAKLKPISQVPNKAGYIQLGVAPYAGAPNNTWWDRDLGIGGRVMVKENNKIVSKLVKLDWPIARIPTLAPHFGAAAQGPFNPETQMVPIIGLEDAEELTVEPFSKSSLIGSAGAAKTFASTQPPRLVRAIANELGLKTSDYGNIINWELELFDVQPATVGGIDKEFIFAGRVDDKLCSWAAIQALVDAQATDTTESSIIKAVGLFDNEEIGSLLRQGARGNFLPSTIERAVTSLNNDTSSASIIGQTYANSFLVSSDVIHAVNPNFLNAYLENHSPRLNVGIVVSADSNGHMTTDSVSTAIMQRCADKVGAKLQVFQIRNDSRSGGTVGPMLSSATGMRAIDCGIPQLSMHSVRATTGNLDPGLGVMAFLGFLNGFESVDKEFR